MDRNKKEVTMSSTEDKKELPSVAIESSKNDSGGASKIGKASDEPGSKEGESGDGKTKPASEASKLTATAKEWKPSATATAFQPRNPQPPAAPQAGNYGVPFGQEQFFGAMGPPMIVVSGISPCLSSCLC